MKRTIEQNNRLHKLIATLNINAEQKEQLVYTYSNGRCTSSRDMSYAECNDLLRFLQSLANERASHADGRIVAMRRKFFAMVREKQWLNNGKINYDRVNQWLLKFSYLHKPLNDYTYNELPKLLSQFERV